MRVTPRPQDVLLERDLGPVGLRSGIDELVLARVQPVISRDAREEVSLRTAEFGEPPACVGQLGQIAIRVAPA